MAGGAGRLRPGAFTQLWRNLMGSFRKRERIVMGKDKFGNLYYEELDAQRASNRGYVPPDNSTDSSWHSKHELWEDWLRMRRHEPPSQEEQAQYDIQHEAKMQRIHALEKEHQKVDAVEGSAAAAPQPTAAAQQPKRKPPKHPPSAYPHVESDESKIDPKSERQYPSYKEYEEVPGATQGSKVK